MRGLIRDMKVNVKGHEVDLPRRIYLLRSANGWTQEELGAKMHVTQSMISAWEKGIEKPSNRRILQICDIAGVSPADFVLGGTNLYNKSQFGF